MCGDSRILPYSGLGLLQMVPDVPARRCREMGMFKHEHAFLAVSPRDFPRVIPGTPGIKCQRAFVGRARFGL